MTGEGVKKKRDPIFSVCFVVFIVACVGVLGSFVDQHYIQEDETVAAYGDKVVVDYTGSFYGFYGDKNAVVFDTSIESIGKDDSVAKSNTFNRTSYSTFDVTIGSGKALTLFENSLVGHKVGDTVKVMIPAGEGYNAPASYPETSSMKVTVPVKYSLTKAAFDEMYSDVKLTVGELTKFTTTYGWDAFATSTGNEVTITNIPVVGETYQYSGNEDSKYGKIAFHVDSVSAESVNVTLSITETVAVDGVIQMLEFEQYNGSTWYITAVDSSSFTYKICGETYNEALYFEIKIISIN